MDENDSEEPKDNIDNENTDDTKEDNTIDENNTEEPKDNTGNEENIKIKDKEDDENVSKLPYLGVYYEKNNDNYMYFTKYYWMQ